MKRAAQRPTFVLCLRPEPRVDGVRALRGLLKVALRKYGLRCVSLNPAKEVSVPTLKNGRPR